jgi:hypothetical protein
VVTFFLHSLWILAALAATVFLAVAVRDWRSIAGAAGGFLASVIWIKPDRLPDPVWVGGLAALAAALQLFHPGYSLASAILGGALAGLCGPLLQVFEFPALLSILLASALAVSVAWLSIRRPGFAPKPLCEEALLVICGLGILTAAAPVVSDGWQSAVALNREGLSGAQNAMPVWVLAVSSAAAAAGGMYTLWRHR